MAQSQHIRRMVQTVIPTRNEAYRRFRTCDRKKVYPSMDKGWDAVHHIKRNGNDLYPDFELRPYVCQFCERIHVGHSNTPRSSEARTHRPESNLTGDLRQYIVSSNVPL